jgi:hypothetical protein
MRTRGVGTLLPCATALTIQLREIVDTASHHDTKRGNLWRMRSNRTAHCIAREHRGTEGRCALRMTASMLTTVAHAVRSARLLRRIKGAKDVISPSRTWTSLERDPLLLGRYQWQPPELHPCVLTHQPERLGTPGRRSVGNR